MEKKRQEKKESLTYELRSNCSCSWPNFRKILIFNDSSMYTCGVGLSSKRSYECHPLSGKHGKAASNVRSDMMAILKEQATSLGVNLDDSALLSDSFICHGYLGAYYTHKEQLEKLKQKANQAIIFCVSYRIDAARYGYGYAGY